MAIATAPPRRPRGRSKVETTFDNIPPKPWDEILEPHVQYVGFDVVDPITFCISPEYLDRPNLYPRQATLLKIIFLRTDMLTDYDHMVIDEWEQQFRDSNGTSGLVPGVRRKMKFLRKRGYRWFRELLLVLGRRAGKGHVTAIAMAYILWNYMSKGDPQEYYGVDRDKKMVCLIFAGKRDQAKSTVYGDLANFIVGAPCFTGYISGDHAESLTVFAPSDWTRMEKRAERGLKSGRDQATFLIQPRESTVMAGRGPTSFQQCYDEAAHVVATGANRSTEEVYEAAKPSLDQFGKDAFIAMPSSPWQMMGKFYENWVLANSTDENGDFEYPAMLSLQLASWEIYYDWERAGLLEMFPRDFPGDLKWIDPETGIEYGEYEPEHPAFRSYPEIKPPKKAMQVFDEEMEREKKANPDTFAVEREAQWAAALDAYLNEQKVKNIFLPWKDRPDRYGAPVLEPQERGKLTMAFKAHGDPSLSNANFGFALAHPEIDADGYTHCVFDVIHHWEPSDWPDHIVDYEEIEDWIWENVITKFYPDELTFDQWNSASTIQKFSKKIRKTQMPKAVNVFEKTATNAVNWSRCETAKKAINIGWVHAPDVGFGRSYEQAELEMRFLQSPRPGVVDKPSSGPIQTKDVADCIFECIQVVIGDQANNFIQGDLSGLGMHGGQQGGFRPAESTLQDPDFEATRSALSGFGAAKQRPGSRNRNPSRRGYRG